MKLNEKDIRKIVLEMLKEKELLEDEYEAYIDEHKNLMLALQDVFKQLHYDYEDILYRMANAVELGNVYQLIVKTIDLHDNVRTFGITINEIIKEDKE